jgi:hypothetical protein
MDIDTGHLAYHNLKKKYDVNVHPKMLYDLSAQGKTRQAFQNKAGITQETFFRWVEEYPEFAEVYKASDALAYEWWVELGLQNCDNDLWDNTVWRHTMNTRFRQFTNGVYLTGFTSLKNAKERYEYISNAVAQNKIIAKEAKNYTDLIEAGQRIESNSDLLARVEALEKRDIP